MATRTGSGPRESAGRTPSGTGDPERVGEEDGVSHPGQGEGDAGALSRVCSILHGTEAPQMGSELISGIIRQLWSIAAHARVAIPKPQRSRWR